MICEFIEKCNFDSNSVLIKAYDLNLDLKSFKLYQSFILNEDLCFDFVSFEEFCINNKIEKIDFLAVTSFDYNFVVNSDILNKTQYIYLEYRLSENRASFSLPNEKWMTRFDTGTGLLFENFAYLETLIDSRGFWTNKNTNEHLFDSSLAHCIVNYLKSLKVKSCVDFGCGEGWYVKFLNENQIKTDGFDGNPFTKEMTNGLCEVLDLSTEFDLGKKYDCVLSLEVGEHIPKEYEWTFIQNIIKHASNFVILSWAIPGQGGHGHVNCVDNSYIKNIFENLGFEHLPFMENILRQTAGLDWFKKTILVFKRKI